MSSCRSSRPTWLLILILVLILCLSSLHHTMLRYISSRCGLQAAAGSTSLSVASRRTMSSGSPHIPVIRSLAQLRRWRAAARERGLEVGVVPTVGGVVEMLQAMLYRMVQSCAELSLMTDGSTPPRAFGSRWVSCAPAAHSRADHGVPSQGLTRPTPSHRHDPLCQPHAGEPSG
jgi:hypothetical protein